MTVALIVDTEKIIADLKIQLEKETPLLVKKIQTEFPDGVEQRILINRYVAGKSFREIARTMGYSLRHIFRVHDRLKKDVIRCHNVSSCVTTYQCDIVDLQKLCTEKLQKIFD